MRKELDPDPNRWDLPTVECLRRIGNGIRFEPIHRPFEPNQRKGDLSTAPFRARIATRIGSVSREKRRQHALEKDAVDAGDRVGSHMAVSTCVGGATLAFLAMATNKSGKLDDDEAHVLITGGSSGIGKAMAVQLVSMGARVTVVARGAEALARVVDEVPNRDNLHVEVADVTDFAAVQAAFRRARNKKGPITMLVCAAGFALPSRFVDAPVDDARAMVQANYLGALHATKAAYEDVEAAGKRGRIMLVASQAAQVGVFGMAAYSGTKWALRGFAEALAMELAPSGARVCVAFPPDTDTPGFANEEIGKPEETRHITGSDTPWKPEDVARRLVRGLLRGDFQVSCGWEGWALATLTCGFAPPNSFLGAVGEVFLLGILRVVALVLRATWIRKVKRMSAAEKATS